MSRIYQSPFRVYFVLALIAILGIVAGSSLPISLFPNSTKPQIFIRIGYGSLTPQEFYQTYGRGMEAGLEKLTVDHGGVDKIEAVYRPDQASLNVEFEWGVSPQDAKKEVEVFVNSYASQLPKEIRESVRQFTDSENTGFLAISFYSSVRSPDVLFRYLDSALLPYVKGVQETEWLDLWNPSKKEVHIDLNPEKMASLKLFPRDIEEAVKPALEGSGGGSFKIGDKTLSVTMERQVSTVEDLSKVVVPTPGGGSVYLGEIANVTMGAPTRNTRIIKTSGAPSVLLVAGPKPGGNIKEMCDEIIARINKVAPRLDKDVKWKILVNPSEFIDSAIRNVVSEVVLAAFLAVLVLFAFIGNLKNVATATIEIPMSIVLALILMKIFGININLISLGGLALSAGMNVDASVVVMENIFRHFDMAKGPQTPASRLKIVMNAVREVRLPILAATIASLVVFLPLAFTSKLTNALLGDLALAVIFSHGLSALVALVLVPTVRLHLMNSNRLDTSSKSPIEFILRPLERAYLWALANLLSSFKMRASFFGGLVLVLALLVTFVLPKLPREIIGSPDTDYLWVGVRSKTAKNINEMEELMAETEARLLEKLGPKVMYTYSQVRSAKRGFIMPRLTDKREIEEIRKFVDESFPDTPELKFHVGQWNPSQLPVPNPPQYKVAIRGPDPVERAKKATAVYDLLRDNKIFKRINSDVGTRPKDSVTLTPVPEQWALLKKQGARLSPKDIADISRVATEGRKVGVMPVHHKNVDVVMGFPKDLVTSLDDIGSLPVGVGNKLVPLKALTRVKREGVPPAIYRENGEEVLMVYGRLKEDEKKEKKKRQALATATIEKWMKGPGTKIEGSVFIEDPEVELTEALNQLGVAVALSVGLIFLTMVFQLGSPISAILVLMAIPLGFIGVISSLAIFKSTLSLNSVLGVILLNGIAVANSIILVDFFKRLVEQGLEPKVAALEAGRLRLRPILMTSMTTGLGMLPIALGLGDGGKILQPLGIAVIGGLGFSTAMTLLVVPTLQASYVEFSKRKALKLRLSPAIFFLAMLLPVSSHASTMSFDKALGEMIQKSYQIDIQKAQVEAADYEKTGSITTFLPSINLNANKYQTNSESSGVKTETRTESFGGSVTLNVFNGGADGAAYKEARENLKKQRNQLSHERLRFEMTASTALLNLLEKKGLKKLAARQLSDMSNFYQIARQRFKKGFLPKQEVDKVQIDLDSAAAADADALRFLNDAKNEVRRYVDFEAIENSWPWKNNFESPKTQKLLSRGVDLNSRPDYRSAQNNVDVQDYRKSKLFGAILPSIDLSYQENRSAIGGGRFEPESVAMVTLTLPLFSGLSDYTRYKVQGQSMLQAEYSLRQLGRDIPTAQKTAQENFKVALETAKKRENTLGLSRAVFKTSLKRFRMGRADANQLLVDEERVINSERNAIIGWKNVHLAFVKLCHAFGLSVRASS